MRNHRISALAMAATVLFAAAMICRAEALDGTKWKVKVVPDTATAGKGNKEFDDELVFADGKFTSKVLLKKGFKPSKYRGDIEPNEAEFEVEQVSGTNGVVTWLGEIRGTNAMGRLQWTQKDGGKLAYEFTGTKK